MRELSKTEEKYILHWGELGSQWGINRTVAQIHALLMISDEPLHAEAISKTLGIARSNTSNSIKELQEWKLIKTVHKLGDRKEYFETLSDVWDLFWAVAERRVNKELIPTRDVLAECLDDAKNDDQISAHTLKRFKELHDFTHMAIRFYDSSRVLPTEVLAKMALADNMKDKIKSLFNK